MENIEIYIDGGLLNKKMFIAILSNHEKFPIKLYKNLGNGTVHNGEEALYTCIDILNQNFIDEEIIIYTDLISLVSILNGKIKAEHLKKFPKILKIQNFIKDKNINVQWIKSSCNIAHKLVILAEKEYLFNKVKPKEAENKNSSNINSNYIVHLQSEIVRKDNLIKDLLQLVATLNNSLQNQVIDSRSEMPHAMNDWVHGGI